MWKGDRNVVDGYRNDVDGYRNDVDGYRNDVDGYRNDVDGYRNEAGQRERVTGASHPPAFESRLQPRHNPRRFIDLRESRAVGARCDGARN
jgi:hypothetical protein